jgi:hypothetical protein
VRESPACSGGGEGAPSRAESRKILGNGIWLPPKHRGEETSDRLQGDFVVREEESVKVGQEGPLIGERIKFSSVIRYSIAEGLAIAMVSSLSSLISGFVCTISQEAWMSRERRTYAEIP